MLKVIDVEQGSGKWLDARRGILTASTIGRLITPKTIKPAENVHTRSLTMQLVAERITRHTEDAYASGGMEMGHFIEPIARDLYAKHYDVEVTELGFMTEDKYGFTLGYSPDGLVGDDGAIEVKFRNQAIQLETIVSGEIPAENIAQMQAGLLVSGRDWIDYLSFSPGMAMWRKRVTLDDVWRTAIITVGHKFEKAATAIADSYKHATEGLPVAPHIEPFAEIGIEL